MQVEFKFFEAREEQQRQDDWVRENQRMSNQLMLDQAARMRNFNPLPDQSAAQRSFFEKISFAERAVRTTYIFCQSLSAEKLNLA